MDNNNNNEPFKNVVMPIIRRVVPTQIARELMGVQPMTAPTGMIFTSRYSKIKWSVTEIAPNIWRASGPHSDEVLEWCKANFGESNAGYRNGWKVRWAEVMVPGRRTVEILFNDTAKLAMLKLAWFDREDENEV